MSKQKVVIKLYIGGNDKKARTKAFKIAVSQPGVESAAMQGEDNYELLLEVVGVQIDAVVLTNSLRKNLDRRAQLVSVGPVDAGVVNNDTAGSDAQSQPYNSLCYGLPHQYPAVYDVRDLHPAECCSIM